MELRAIWKGRQSHVSYISSIPFNNNTTQVSMDVAQSRSVARYTFLQVLQET